MTSQITIPQGEETVMVELTVKQAMALSGLRFYGNRHLMAEARRKVMRTLDDNLLSKEADKVHYHNIHM